jgi:sugar/nucleoside kinase (ribokinase family)
VTPDVVILGNLLVDDLVFADGQTRLGQAGGAVLYAALAARVWGARVGCVSVAGSDYPQAMLDRMEACGIDLAGVSRWDRPGVRAWLLYEHGARQLIHRLGCPSHEEVSPSAEQIPVDWRSARAMHLAPMPLAVQRTLLTSLADCGAFVSVDPHHPVTDETLPEWRSVLAHADAFFPGEDELRIPEATTNPQAVLPRLVSGRLRFVALTQGAKGGLLYDARDRRFHSWSARTERLVGPTGAGDAFAAGFVTAHAAGLPVERCLQRAQVTASFALEAWGPDGLVSATPESAADRYREWERREARA